MNAQLKEQTLSQALRIVKFRVAMSWVERLKPGTSYYICFAAENAVHSGCITRKHGERIQEIVMSRLARAPSLRCWLVAQGVDIGEEEGGCNERVQLHRVAWLELLAKEFES